MKVTVTEYKKLSVEKDLNKNIPYLNDTINNLKKSDTWGTQLAIAIDYICSEHNGEKCIMQWKSENGDIKV